MSKKTLDEKLAELRPTVDLNPKAKEVKSPLIKSIQTIQFEATENQLKHLISHMKMLKIQHKIL